MSASVEVVSRVIQAATLVALLSFASPTTQAGLNRWTPIGPEGGAISLIVTDTRHPGSVYALAGGGGLYGGTRLFHSPDRGDHWVALDLGVGDIRVQRLLIDPARLATVSRRIVRLARER